MHLYVWNHQLSGFAMRVKAMPLLRQSSFYCLTHISNRLQLVALADYIVIPISEPTLGSDGTCEVSGNAGASGLVEHRLSRPNVQTRNLSLCGAEGCGGIFIFCQREKNKFVTILLSIATMDQET
jgi:hypothetical protein